MDMKLELVAVPVTDVDRAKEFYVSAGFNADHDHRVSDDVRFVQLTPPGSACSIAIGKGLTTLAPGCLDNLQAVVEDAAATRADLLARGVEVSDLDEQPWGTFVRFSDPDGNRWSLQQLPDRSATSTDPATTPAGGSIDREAAQAWLDRYVDAWMSYDRADIASLFSEDVAYRYHPYDEPIVGRDAVVASWLGELEADEASSRDAPDTYEAEYSPLAVDGDTVVATGTSRYLAEPGGPVVRTFENCFVMRFDDEGRCREFTEYYQRRP